MSSTPHPQIKPVADNVLSDVTKEMQQPSEAESVRIEERKQVTEDDEEGSVYFRCFKVSMTSKAWFEPPFQDGLSDIAEFSLLPSYIRAARKR